MAHGFGTISLDGYADGRFPFLSATYQNLMLEIWKVKYLQMPRFGEVIRTTVGRRLDHFLDDGDSPDIPIPSTSISSIAFASWRWRNRRSDRPERISTDDFERIATKILVNSSCSS